MGNSLACISPGGKTSGHGRTIKELEHSDRSFRNLQTLKRKSKLRSYYKAKSRSLQSTLVNKIVPVSSFIWEAPEENDDRTENGGVTRVKMVLTRKEVAELLSKLRNSGGRGGVTVEDLGEVVNEGSGRIGWSPSLQSIPESDNVPDE